MERSIADALTTTWLLEQKPLELEVLHDTGVAFTVVHPCELEDPTEFIGAGAVILLTGIAFEGRPEALIEYVHRVASAGIVGVGFGVGLVFDEVPPGVAQAAEEAGITLFVVPRPIPFVSILAAADAEKERRANAARRALMDTQEMLNAAAPSGADALLAVAATRLGAHVILVDNDLRIVSSYMLDSLPPLNEAELSRLLREHGFGLAAKVGSLTVVGHSMTVTGERRHGLIAASDGPISNHARAALKHCAGLAELMVARPVELRATHQELNTLAMAIQLGIDTERRSMERVFREVSDNKGKVRPVLLKADLPRAHDRAIAALDTDLARSGRLLCALRLDPVTSLILFRGSRTYPNILAMMMPARGSNRVVVGAELPWQELSRATVTRLEKVAFGLRPGESAGPDAQALTWLSDSHVHAALTVRAEQTWGKLADYDAGHGSDLVATLEVFLRNSGHVSKTADLMATHRHTIRKRIADIQDILEVDLSNPAVAAELLIVAISNLGA